MAESQAIESYGCKCGFKTISRTEHMRHIRLGQKTDGKEAHATIGRVNAAGEVVLPPYMERTKEQLAATKHGLRQQKDIPDDEKKPKRDTEAIRQTSTLANAQQIKMVTRVFTVDYTPTMKIGYEASHRLWGWQMPFEDFLDTVIWRYFKIHGVTLESFTIDETPEEKAKREAALAIREEVINVS